MQEIKEIKAKDIFPLLQDESWQFLDVRQQSERSAGFLPGLHIPLEALEQRVKEVDPLKNTLVYCRCGNRSETAIRQLEALGFEKGLVNLSGGILSMHKEQAKGGERVIVF